MANFEVNVVKIDNVVDHPNADRLSIIQIGGYNCISAKVEGKHRYKAGEMVCYIPEGSVMPDSWLKEHGFWKDNKGMLAGSKGNRVKAIKLRGVFSEGLLHPVELSGLGMSDKNIWTVFRDDGVSMPVCIGDDVADFLRIVKYEPPIPTSLAGEVFNAGVGVFTKFDIEALEKYPNVLEENEHIILTEKIHGSNFQMVFLPNEKFNETFQFDDGCVCLASKGLGARGLGFKINDNNKLNAYIRVCSEQELHVKLRDMSINEFPNKKVTVIGEIYGSGIQDLQYGQRGLDWRLFDILVNDEYLDAKNVVALSAKWNLKTVPILYEGPYSMSVVEKYRDGKDSISNSHVREGVVIRVDKERKSPELGRTILKAVSPAYKLRGGDATEYN